MMENRPKNSSTFRCFFSSVYNTWPRRRGSENRA